MMKRLTAGFLCLLIILGFCSQSRAKGEVSVQMALQTTANCVLQTATNPSVGQIGGDWAVLGLARSGEQVPNDYFALYYENAKDYIKKQNGVLSQKKYTEYSRVILAMTSVGKNPRDVAGYDLLVPLADFERTVYQGINGAVFALIALDSANYEIPQNTEARVQSTRQMYVDYILNRQNSDGGWAVAESAEESEPDMTAMALQALGKYQNQQAVNDACQRAIKCLQNMQNQNAGFDYMGQESSESCAQVIVALCEMGMSPYDERFAKNGKTLVDNLLDYYIDGKGFLHTKEDPNPNQMATEQALYCLAAINRFEHGQNSLYNMTDTAVEQSTEGAHSIGLPNKNTDVNPPKVAYDGKTFDDTTHHANSTAIESLASRGIINGKSQSTFDPDGTMTRAEFATIVVRALGVPTHSGAEFDDVVEGDWFFEYVNTACYYGIVNGISPTEFDPQGTITREESAVMTARAAKLCGMNTDLNAAQVRDTLAEFVDYVEASDWAWSSLAFCYANGILPDDDCEINPKQAVTRAQIAQIVYNMLWESELLQGEM